METAGTAQDQIQFEMADADAELMDALGEHTEPTAADAHDTAQGMQAQAQAHVDLYANHTPAGSRASSVARRAFGKLSIEEAAEKQVREVREALEAMFEKDLIAMTAQQLADHASKQEAYQRIIEAYETRLKRKRDGDSSLFASDSHANRMHHSKLDNLLKSKCPELSSASQSAFDAWRQLVNNKFMMVTGHDHDGTQRSRWALTGIKSDLSTLVNPLAKACDEADEMDVPLTWQKVQELLQDIIKNPTVRRTELANQYFNCRQKQGQSVQSFADYLKNLEERMDALPFDDGATKVDFYFAKLHDVLQAKIIEQDLLKSCPSIKDLVASAVRFEQISKAAKAPAAHDNRNDIARESRADRGGRGRGASSFRGQSRGRGRRSYGSGTNVVPQAPRPEQPYRQGN
jgi:hypothetical protein